MQKTSLLQFKQGDNLKITEVHCGQDFARRLSDLGLFEETEVMLVKNDNFGPLIIKIFNSKVAIGRGEASKIYAEKA